MAIFASAHSKSLSWQFMTGITSIPLEAGRGHAALRIIGFIIFDFATHIVIFYRNATAASNGIHPVRDRERFAD
jgi:hypothetical protein